MAGATPPLHHHHHAQARSTTLSAGFLPLHENGAVIFRFRSRSHTLSFSSQCCSRQQPRRSVPRVSTAPVELVPPAPDFDFRQEIARLRGLRGRISAAGTLGRKLEVLDSDCRVSRFFSLNKAWFDRVSELADLDSYDVYLIKSLVAAGQEHVLTYGLDLDVPTERELEPGEGRSSLKSALYSLAEMIESWDVSRGGGVGGGNFRFNRGFVLKEVEVGALRSFLKTMREVEKFYDCIGGVVGYQIAVLQLLAEAPSQQTINGSSHMNESLKCDYVEIHSPRGVDISKNTEYASQAALWGIEGLPDLAEIYPLGGSADRLGLVDPDTGDCLPAAMLPFCGRTLLEGLIRDLQAREFLYFKIYGKQCITPVAIMTSAAKHNHERITSHCEKLNWFGRGRSSFKLFEQPLVPAISAEDGGWLVAEPFTPVCKPGGHGVIWKLAHDTGVFPWLYSHGRRGATVRQVSNVVAATDLTLLALAGIGLHHNKKLGFASCKRTSGATEGINVLMERRDYDGNWAYGLSCVEYTEFDKFGISDGLHPNNSSQADFPANTNILYIDLHSVERVASSNDQTSLPGLVLNIKKPIVYLDHFGIRRSVSGGRLECTMQNIADNLCNTYLRRCYKEIEDQLDTFLVYNERRRVTSSAKKKRRPGDMSLHQTPDGALLDITRNAFDLLSQCNIWMPKIGSNNEYTESGPPYLIFLHPALGPLWEVTRQKFQGGSISKGSELQVEVSELYWRDVQLDGSMIIDAENAMGAAVKTDSNDESILQYGHRCARCKLQNVRVVNKGVDWESGENIYWKHQVQRHESLKIVLHGNAEFDASNVTIEGDHVFEVPDGHRMTISSDNRGGLSTQLEPIEDHMMNNGSWFWSYKVEGAHIKLSLVEL